MILSGDHPLAAAEARFRADPEAASLLDAIAAASLAGLPAIASDLAQQVAELKATRSLPGSDPTLNVMLRELRLLGEHIANTKREIAALQPAEGAPDSRIAAATGELDAIVTATERATSDILTATEAIQSLMEKLMVAVGDNADAVGVATEIEGHALTIMMACSFQDLTGQRVTKVVHTLRYLEERVTAMVKIWSPEEGTDRLLTSKPGDTRPDAHLLHGPQSDADRPDQADIDAMFD